MPYPRFRINMPLQEIISSVMTSLGKERKSYVREFASAFRRFGGFESAVMTGSGRSGFRLLLESLDFEPGSEIIFPAYTFHPIPVAAAECGLVPIFADVDAATWNIKPEAILSRITERTRAVVPTHLFGVPAGMDEILAIAREHSLFVIEDCAHALGATYRGRPVGNFGNASVFTFAMSKNLPCWGGGAVVVKDTDLAKKMTARIMNETSPPASSILHHQLANIAAMVLTQPLLFPWTLYPVLRIADVFKSDYFDKPFLEPVTPPRLHTRKQLAVSGEQLKEDSKRSAVSGKQLKEDSNRLAVSSEQLKEDSKRLAVSSKQSTGPLGRLPLTAYRSLITPMSPLQAATGLRQLKRFPAWLERQVRKARRLRQMLANCPKLQLQQEPPETRSAFLYVRARVENPVTFRRALLHSGVDTKPDDMRNCALLKIFEDHPACSVAEYLAEHCIEIPCSPFYSERQIDDIAERILESANY